ncbi:hypothetical protein BIV24_11680 [Streptomyces colonosanans]|uniref:Uncharacterized protein n=1 Tax=Streptomyces colonosanans TaxID=1428652 RepID=A0A1S2PIL4_9ACTN|nr:hypothetical protein BIV24_11680 [Streptomyces colonosanans]
MLLVGWAAVAYRQACDERVASGGGDTPDGVVLVLLNLHLQGRANEAVVLGQRDPRLLFQEGELCGVG